MSLIDVRADLEGRLWMIRGYLPKLDWSAKSICQSVSIRLTGPLYGGLSDLSMAKLPFPAP